MAFILVLVFVPVLMAAPLPPTSINLGESQGLVEIARCHFDEGRIVIRHTDKLHVLREGDTLEGTGLRVVEITPEAATLTIRQGSPNGSLRIIRITGTDSGTLLLREFATDPATSTAGSAADAPRVPISTMAPGKPKPKPDGD